MMLIHTDQTDVLHNYSFMYTVSVNIEKKIQKTSDFTNIVKTPLIVDWSI